MNRGRGKGDAENHLSILQPVERTALLRAYRQLVPTDTRPSTRAGELLRHALFLCETPVWKLRNERLTLRVCEAKYAMLAAEDLATIAHNRGVDSWQLIVFHVLVCDDRADELADLLRTVMAFVDQHTVMKELVPN